MLNYDYSCHYVRTSAPNMSGNNNDFCLAISLAQIQMKASLLNMYL